MVCQFISASVSQGLVSIILSFPLALTLTTTIANPVAGTPDHPSFSVLLELVSTCQTGTSGLPDPSSFRWRKVEWFRWLNLQLVFWQKDSLWHDWAICSLHPSRSTLMGCIFLRESKNGFVISNHSDHGASKEHVCLSTWFCWTIIPSEQNMFFVTNRASHSYSFRRGHPT